MKTKISFWIAVGAGISAVISIAARNLPAGLFIGTGTSLLLMIITNLETDKKIRN